MQVSRRAARAARIVVVGVGVAAALAACAPRRADRRTPAPSPPVLSPLAAPPTPSTPPPAAGRPGVTVADTSPNAFSLPLPGLSSDERRAFAIGNAFFHDPWVTAPSSTSGRDGLGPTFNATSCAGCHVRDGRAAPPSPGDPDRIGLLVRLSVVDAAGRHGPHPAYGDQLQDRAIRGVPPEGDVVVGWQAVAGAYADGTPYNLWQPRVSFAHLAFGPIGNAGDAATVGGAHGRSPRLAISPRIAPAVFGLGLLEAVPEADIVGRADPDDADGDGISGRPNWVVDDDGRRLGRFGWKAGQATIEDQTVAAFLADIGITSAPQPVENCPAAQVACAAAPTGGSPELDVDRLARIVHYSRTLAVPSARGATSPTVAAGAALFAAARCDACHVPRLRTGPRAAVAVDALADQAIAPYTDLLLHDMGAGLADDRPEHDATGVEWRTPPLWGVGLIPTVNGHDRLLHDGRARGIAEAILWHGGEAEGAKERFRAMTRSERDALVAYVASR